MAVNPEFRLDAGAEALFADSGTAMDSEDVEEFFTVRVNMDTDAGGRKELREDCAVYANQCAAR